MTSFLPCEGFLTWLLVPEATATLLATKLLVPNDSRLLVPGWWAISEVSFSFELVWCNDSWLWLELFTESLCRLWFGVKFNLLCRDDNELLDVDASDEVQEFRLLSFRFLPLGGKLWFPGKEPLPLTDIQTTNSTKRHWTQKVDSSTRLPTGSYFFP